MRYRDDNPAYVADLILYVCFILFMFAMIFHVTEVNERLTKIVDISKTPVITIKGNLLIFNVINKRDIKPREM